MSKNCDVFAMSEEEVEAFLNSEDVVGEDFDLGMLSLDEKHALAFSIIESRKGAETETVHIEKGTDTRNEKAHSSSGKDLLGVSESGIADGEVVENRTSNSRESASSSTSSELEPWQSELVDEFVEVSGAEREIAMRMLEAFGYEMDAAMVMYMEQGSTKVSNIPDLMPMPPSESSLSVNGNGVPFPPLPNAFGDTGDIDDRERDSGGDGLDEFGLRRPDPIRNQRLVDSRDALSTASYDDVMGRAEDESVDWMFPPPAHLSFVGNLDMAVEISNSERKWLLVNIQYHEEFSSHMLNRDTWCDEMVEQVVRSSFIFWQRGSTSREAKRYISIYKLEEADMPHISIIDPRTKAKVCSMKGYVSPQELVAFLVKFLEDNDINANKAPKSTPTYNNIDLQQRALDRSGMIKEGRDVDETPPMGMKKSEKGTGHSSYLDLDSVARTLDDIGTDSSETNPQESKVSYGVAPEEPAEGAPGSFKVQLKLPNGKPVKRRFLTLNTVKELHAVALEAMRNEGIEDGPFSLTTSFPIKSLSDSQSFEKSLGETEVAGAQIIVRKL